MTDLPAEIHKDAELDELLSRPTPAVVEVMKKLPGDIAFLGVGGKMGPTLARMAVRASEAAGVKRISVGGALSRLALAAFLDGAREMKDKGTFTWVRRTVPSKELKAIFK